MRQQRSAADIRLVLANPFRALSSGRVSSYMIVPGCPPYAWWWWTQAVLTKRSERWRWQRLRLQTWPLTPTSTARMMLRRCFSVMSPVGDASATDAGVAEWRLV